MTTFASKQYNVGLTFENTNITIGGRTIEEHLSDTARKDHTHEIDDINGLDTKIRALENKDYIITDGNNDASIAGDFECNDVKVWIDGASRSVVEKITTIEENTLSNTIQHMTVTDDTNVRVGYPVFLTGEVVGKELNYSLLTATDCVPVVKSTGDFKTFVGVCTEVNATFKDKNTVVINGNVYAYTRYATHGDFQFHVSNSHEYQIGDLIKYDGSTVDYDANMTYKENKSIVGVITGIINPTTVAVFRS